MGTEEQLPCHCGKGTIHIEVTVFGTWRVEGVLLPCRACESTDIQKAREASKKVPAEEL